MSKQTGSETGSWGKPANSGPWPVDRCISSNDVVNNVQFFAQTDPFASYDLNILSGATGIYFVLPDAFLTLKVTAAIDSHFMNHQWPLFQLKIFFTVLLKKKVTYILDGLSMSK